MRDVDALLKETDDALRRIEGLKRAKRDRVPLAQRVGVHTRRFSNQLLNVALAAGLMGLSMLRYHENASHRTAISELEREIVIANGRAEALAVAVDAAVRREDSRKASPWWGRSVGGHGELREALMVFQSRKTC